MNLSISNIAWTTDQDEAIYSLMQKYSFSGLEIAPTRIFPETPYRNLDAAKQWSNALKKDYGFSIPSMQSIWYGRQEKIFGSPTDREMLISYTKKAIDFAVRIGCKNLVFGCPRNRTFQNSADLDCAVPFFKILGDYAAEHGVVIGLEANPPIYHTNYINDTKSALELIKEVGSHGFMLNLDVGTMIQNGENVVEIEDYIPLISHVHISEPGLQPIQERTLHYELKNILQGNKYSGFVSIETGNANSVALLEKEMSYVKGVFS
ncbi:MAG: sugar phosphate isomerase/epimerase [Ruminococcus flavefaciens]|nr:sugar phosphate isomerase/epimerase [Ruminococcus flavefaciens]